MDFNLGKTFHLNVAAGLAAVLVCVSAQATAAWADTASLEWTQQLGTSGNDYGDSVAVDTAGNAYISGITAGALDGNINAGSMDVFLIKYDLVTIPESTTLSLLAVGVLMACRRRRSSWPRR